MKHEEKDSLHMDQPTVADIRFAGAMALPLDQICETIPCPPYCSRP